MSTVPPPAPAENENTSLWDAIKGEHPYKGSLRWILLYVATAAVIVIKNLVSNATGIPSPDDYSGSGTPTSSFTAGSTITWLAGTLLLIIAFRVFTRTETFAEMQSENPKLGAIFTIVKVVAKRAFILAVVVSVAFVFDWGLLFTLFILALVAGLFYLIDRNKVKTSTLSNTAATNEVNGLNGIDAPVVIQFRGNAPLGYMHVQTIHPDEIKHRGLVDGEWVMRNANGIHIFKLVPPPPFAQPSNNAG